MLHGRSASDHCHPAQFSPPTAHAHLFFSKEKKKTILDPSCIFVVLRDFPQLPNGSPIEHADLFDDMTVPRWTGNQSDDYWVVDVDALHPIGEQWRIEMAGDAA